MDYLVPERVWLETEKALHTESFDLYFKTLCDLNAINDIYPDLNGIDQVIANSSLTAYKNVSPELKLASLFCAVDTVRDENVVDHLDEIQNRIKFPNSYKSFAKSALRTTKILNESRGNISADDIYEIIQQLMHLEILKTSCSSWNFINLLMMVISK